MMTIKIKLLSLVGAVFVAGIGASSSALSADADLIAAAKKEGKLVVYHSINRKVLKAMASDFGKKYGIDVQATRKSTGGVSKMIAAEKLAGVLKCDIVSVGDATLFRTWKSQGLLHPYVPTSQSSFYEGDADPEGYSSPARRTAAAVGYSKNAVKDSEVPTGWQDVLDPKWKGKIGVIDPRSSAPGRFWLAAMVKEFGWGYIEKLAKLQPIMIKSSSTAALNLVSGEVAFTLPGSEHGLTKRIAKGEPVGLVYPKEGAVIKTSRVGICANPPNPNAAKLWIEYETSVEGQEIINKLGAYITVRPDAPDFHNRPAGALDPKKLIHVPEAYMRENKKMQREKFAEILTKALQN